MTFDVRWYGKDQSADDGADFSTAKKEESAKESCPCKQKAQQKESEPVPSRQEKASLSMKAETPLKAKKDFDEKIDEIDETWREKWQAINAEEDKPAEQTEKIEKAAPVTQREEKKSAQAVEEISEEPLKCCPYSAYCLRYYRIQEGDELERIAEKFPQPYELKIQCFGRQHVKRAQIRIPNGINAFCPNKTAHLFAGFFSINQLFKRPKRCAAVRARHRKKSQARVYKPGVVLCRLILQERLFRRLRLLGQMLKHCSECTH